MAQGFLPGSQAGCLGQVDGSASREAVRARVVPERERDLGDLGAIWSIVGWRGGGQTATWKGRGGEQAGRGEKEWTWPHHVVTHAAAQGLQGQNGANSTAKENF